MGYSDVNRAARRQIICTHCRKVIGVNSIFCPMCGKRLVGESIMRKEGSEKGGGVSSVVDKAPEVVGQCELCAQRASKLYSFDMYRILNGGYAPPFGWRLRYATQKVSVKCCDGCHASLTRADGILAVCWLILALIVFVSFARHINGLFAFIISAVMSGVLAAIPMMPFYLLFSGERQVGRKSQRVARLLDDGWKFGKKPNKSDMGKR